MSVQHLTAADVEATLHRGGRVPRGATVVASRSIRLSAGDALFDGDPDFINPETLRARMDSGLGAGATSSRPSVRAIPDREGERE